MYGITTVISILTRKWRVTLFLCLFFLPLLTNCASVTKNQAIFSSPVPEGLQEPYSPGFIIKDPEKQYNLIGTPSAQSDNHDTEIFVDSSAPTIYFESQVFSTKKQSYKNLIYRIHFEKVPFDLSKLHLTTGKNPGILIIYTIDQENRLLLITTVHTCGCYLAFIPTDNLPRAAYPENWPDIRQEVYGHSLPSVLKLPSQSNSGKIFFSLESGNHRIGDAELFDSVTVKGATNYTLMQLSPISSLYRLPFKDTTVSFFEEQGKRQGYVKNNLKILERLLISWWAFDLRVGEDKAYGKDDVSTIPLYTSLKFWRREASDLKNFPRFLSYWGWDL